MKLKDKFRELYLATTQARTALQTAKRVVKNKIQKENPELKWYEIDDKVDNSPEVVKAANYLYGLCEACNILKIQAGE